MSGPDEPTRSVAVPPLGPRQRSRGAAAGMTSAGCCPDTWTRSATDAPSAAASLHKVAIDGFASPFSICTSTPLLTSESAASRSSDRRRSWRRSRIRLESSWTSCCSDLAAGPARFADFVTRSGIHQNDRLGQYNDRGGRGSEASAARGFELDAGRLQLRVAAGDALHLLVGQRPVRRLRRGEDAIDDLLGGRQAAALQPED